jgi:hypothetical protein
MHITAVIIFIIFLRFTQETTKPNTKKKKLGGGVGDLSESILAHITSWRSESHGFLAWDKYTI